MHAILHSICAIVVLPYVALALFFIFVAQMASSKGMMDILETAWNNFYVYFGWGIYVAPLLWVFLIAMGFVSALQRTGSLCLCLLAVCSLIVIVIFPKSRIELGHLLFFAPCVAVAVTSAWLIYRSGSVR